MFDAEITAAATRLLDACKAAGVMVATAESCTGGLIAGALTEIAGSSAVVDRGFVTYSNEAKAAMLGVPPAMIDAHGAVSEAMMSWRAGQRIGGFIFAAKHGQHRLAGQPG